MNHIKKSISISVILSLIGNMTFSVSAVDLVDIPQNNTSVIIPPNSSIVQNRSTEFSMKSIEEKINNVLNPVKNEKSNQAELLVSLVSDDFDICGTDLGYKFTASTGELKIFGTGDMTDYTYNTMPWYSYKSYITSLVIENEVTSIGDYAFYGCSGLTSVTIGNSVKKIGTSAFCCSWLNSITIPDSVTEIGSSAFEGCSWLDSITISDKVTYIGSYAFNLCSGLTSINVDENNTNYKSIDGILYYYDGKTLIQCPGGKTGEVNIPDSVTEIGSSAFEGCSGLTSVTYKGTSDPGASSSNVFDGCNQLKAVNVPSNYTDKTFCGMPIKKPATNPFTPNSKNSFNPIFLLLPFEY